MRRRLLPLLAASVLVSALAACAPTPVPEPASSSAPSTGPSPSAEAPEADPVFAPATSCAGMLGPLEAELLAEGLVLFSSTDGGGIYHPIASTQDGGDPFSCWYGKDGVDLSSVELATQPVDQAEHEGIVAVLGGGGFTVSSDGDVVTFVQVGDEGSVPAIVHVLRPDSWLTGYSALGGADRVTELSGYLEQVAVQLYS